MSNNTQWLNMPYPVLADKDFNLTDKAVYCYLLGWSKTTDTIFPSVALMAETFGCGESAVKAATRKLELAGKITKRRQFNKSNVYTVNDWTAQEQPQRAPQQEQPVVKVITSTKSEIAPQAVTRRPTGSADWLSIIEDELNPY